MHTVHDVILCICGMSICGVDKAEVVMHIRDVCCSSMRKIEWYILSVSYMKRSLFGFRSILIFVGLYCSNIPFAAGQEVNPFTGDLSYSLPLLNVPSPDGPGVPVSLYYGAGIGVNQPSSEVGLGWSLMAGGAVSRLISGIADDWKQKTVTDTKKQSIQQAFRCLVH